MKYIKLGVLSLLLLACSSNTLDLENFDEVKWQSDISGCKGERLSMLKALQEVKDNLKGLNQNELTELLGKPERHELYKRSQKFFYYQISPGESCNEPAPQDIYLSIRFNATGLAKEVIIMNYQE